jgi:type I restriction enzyme, S subunit
MSTMKPLGTFCEFKYGRSLPEKNRKGGDFPVYGSNGIVGYHDSPLTLGPTIIVGRKGSVGALQFSQTACFPIDTTYYVDPSCTDADLKWLFFMLQKLDLKDLNKHVAVPGLNREDAYEKELPVPPLEQQRRIGVILEKANMLRLWRRESFQLTGKLRQSAFRNMFGDLDVNPNNWAQVPLENLCQTIVDCPHSTPVYSEVPTDYYCIRSSEIQNGRLELSAAKYVSAEIYAERISRHEPQAGEVIYTREGGRLGYAAQVPTGIKVCLGQRMMLFSAEKPMASNAFLNGLLNSESFRAKVFNLVGGGAAPRVNIKDLRAIQVYKPPIEIQLHYEQVATALDWQEQMLNVSEKQSSILFSSVHQRAFRGELDLSRLVLNQSAELPAPEPAKPAPTSTEPHPTALSFQAPESITAALKELDGAASKGEPIPWSADYFKYRILGAHNVPFSFGQLMQKAESVFDELPYEEIKDIILDLLGRGDKPAVLAQMFDLNIDATTKETSGRKEILFGPAA